MTGRLCKGLHTCSSLSEDHVECWMHKLFAGRYSTSSHMIHYRMPQLSNTPPVAVVLQNPTPTGRALTTEHKHQSTNNRAQTTEPSMYYWFFMLLRNHGSCKQLAKGRCGAPCQPSVVALVSPLPSETALTSTDLSQHLPSDVGPSAAVGTLVP